MRDWTRSSCAFLRRLVAVRVRRLVRGELSCFVLADGSAKPSRVHMRDPSFVNLQSLKKMAEGSLIADFIAAVAMLDPILGGVDR